MLEHKLESGMTTWHITWGTYGTRLHGDERPTVDRSHNGRGTEFVQPDTKRHSASKDRMRNDATILNGDQCQFVQQIIPQVCEKGGWTFRVCSAAPDHVHVLLDVVPSIHGEKVRRLLKRWLTQSLNEQFDPKPRWWAEEGSNKAVKDKSYLNRVYQYIEMQRTK